MITIDAVVNVRARPRVLVHGLDDYPELLEKLTDLVPTVRKIGSLDEVRQAEWDALITDDLDDLGAEAHLFMLVVFPAELPQLQVNAGYMAWRGQLVQFRSRHICEELKRPEAAGEPLRKLVKSTLEPVVAARVHHTHFQLVSSSSAGSGRQSASIEPFLLTADNKNLAGRILRSDEAEAWLVPDDATDLWMWIESAIVSWHVVAPDRFPGLPLWSDQLKWLTNEERALQDEAAEIERERSAALSEFDRRVEDNGARLKEAKIRGDKYERLLVTGQNDELKDAVLRALVEIGFTVLDADAERPDDEHLEDLRIQDPDTPDWMALGEVKGYSKGAQTGAFAQFIRFQARYVQSSGKHPDALWYIVNQFKDQAPDSRPLVLNGRDEDVASFASVSGLIIDTVNLFGLLGRVRAGWPSADARKALRSANGRLVLPAPDTGL